MEEGSCLHSHRLMAAREVSKHMLSGFHHMGKGMGMTV
jgi:hypothetical protein